MELALVYDPRYHTWDSWCALMCEAYAAQQLSIGIPEKNWKDWARGLNAIDVFANDAVPSSEYYDDWRDWASALVGAVSQRV